MKIILLIIACLSTVSLFAQELIIGKVVSDFDKSPLENVTVHVEGTSLNSKTNKDGVFKFQNIEASIVTLEFRHLGYKSLKITIDLPQNESLNVSLSVAAESLAEVDVVSTGYQTVSKERVTGSFTTVSNELLNQQVGSDLLSRLPSVANSMIMDNAHVGAPQLMIRGLSTIRGPKAPLIIVDNFPYDGELMNINPNIVENITILKDASASSIWGARAGNGVIVITTKKGELNRPVSLEFTSNLQIGTKPNLNYIEQMSAADYIDLEKEMFAQGFYDNDLNSINYPVISPVIDLLEKGRSNLLTDQEVSDKIEGLKNLDVRDQFDRYVYRPSVNQQYFLGANGGGSKFSWISSLGLDRDKANLGEIYQRVNFRIQNTYQPFDGLNLSTAVYFTQSKKNSGRLGYHDVSMKSNTFVPYMQLADQNGDPLWIIKDYSPRYIESLESNDAFLDWKYYPLTDWQHDTEEKKLSNILASFSVDYRLLFGLNLKLNYQYEKQWDVNSNLSDENSYFARDNINRFVQIDDGVPEYIVPKGGVLNTFNRFLDSHNIRGQLNFDKAYGKHSIVAIAGVEMRSNTSNGQQMRYYGYTNNLTTAVVDYQTRHPANPSGSAYISAGQSLSENSTRFLSQFANAAYDYDNRLMVSASIRRDGSNLFGLKTNDQWNPFWSLGTAWKLSNESFYQVHFLPYLNLRSTYGFSGNIDPAMVAVNTISYLGQKSFYNGEPMAYFSNYYNPELKWETSKMLNIGIDFQFNNSRFSGSIEYYHKEGKNLFGVVPMDYTNGISTAALRNVANMESHGWDIELKTVNVDREFKWQTILNFSLNSDEIIAYNIERSLAQQYVDINTPPVSGIKGHPVYAIYAYKWAGLDPLTGEAQGYLDGEVSKDYNNIVGVGTKIEDLELFGSAIPTKFGSMINSFSYKNITFNVGLSFKFGYWFRRNSINYTNLLTTWRGHSDYQDRWQHSGDEVFTNVPVNQYTTNSNRDMFYNGSSVLVEKADHIRLQYLRLAYDFKNETKHIKNFQLFLNAQNIGLIWAANKRSRDPDFSRSGHNLPVPKSFTVGVRSKF